jgi:hypothetical protein
LRIGYAILPDLHTDHDRVARGQPAIRRRSWRFLASGVPVGLQPDGKLMIGFIDRENGLGQSYAAEVGELLRSGGFVVLAWGAKPCFSQWLRSSISRRRLVRVPAT